uniref:Uncharacterized protein n=1 Tax=viral metagenome TaxID=1070528 RepID=A0A6C0KWW2_9ZZZZ
MNNENKIDYIKKIIIKILLLIVVGTLLVFCKKSNWLIFSGMTIMLIYIHFYLNLSIYFLVFVGFGGSFAESVVMYLTDLWKYKSPNLGNIPCWLPLLWSIVGTGVIGIYELISIIKLYFI